jgi:uncharacterized protein HemY
MAPEVFPLAVECFSELLQANRAREALDMVAHLAPAVAERGRVRLLQAQAALAVGDWRQAHQILENLEVGDIREGDNAITDLWFSVQEQRLADQEHVAIDDQLRERVRHDCPPPRQLDYRMFRQRK